MGVKLLEGIFTAHTKPVDKISKNYKYVASFGALEFKDNKPTLKLCKIPVSKINLYNINVYINKYIEYGIVIYLILY